VAQGNNILVRTVLLGVWQWTASIPHSVVVSWFVLQIVTSLLQVGVFGAALWWLSCELEDLGFDSQQQQEIFLFSWTSRLAVVPMQLPITRILVVLYRGIKWPGR